MKRALLICLAALGAAAALTPLGTALGTTVPSEEARWALDEAEYYESTVDAARDDLATFRTEVLPFLPGGPAEYRDALAASRADIRASEDYAAALRSAAADGRITAAERADLDDARQAAEDAEDVAYMAFKATPAGPLLEFNERLTGALADMVENSAAP